MLRLELIANLIFKSFTLSTLKLSYDITKNGISCTISTSDGRNTDTDVNNCKSNTAKFHVGKLKIFCRDCALP